MKATSFENIDDYIASFGSHIREILKTIRSAITSVAPDAEECISYGMPAFRYHGVLVYFAAAKNHIGFYPTPSGVEAFKKYLKPYKTSKGAIQFPIDKPIPLELIKKIVQFRVDENKQKIK